MKDTIPKDSIQGEDYSLDEYEEKELLDDTTTEFNFAENESIKSAAPLEEKDSNNFSQNENLSKVPDKSSFKE